MFKPIKEAMNPQKVQELWTYLVRWERRLKRNVLLCRIIQPLGATIFTLNMLLATMNLLMFLGSSFAGGAFITDALQKVPLLPSMIENLPRESWGGVLFFFVWFAFLIPLAISGIVLAVLLILELQKKKPIPTLSGTEAEQAAALAHEAEWVYGMRKKLPQWSIFMETTILTALTAWPILSICLQLLGGEDPAVLIVALACFAMLVCLFVVFWVYAALFWSFAKLNALYYIAPSEWKFWELFNDLDDYWESVDPEEYARRELVAAQKGRKNRNNR